MNNVTGGIFIRFPWLTVQRHLNGKHNQKEHGRRAGDEQGTLFDRDEFLDESEAKAQRLRAEQEAIFQRKKRAYAEMGVAVAESDNENHFMVWLQEAEDGWAAQSGGWQDFDDFLDGTFNYVDYDAGLRTAITDLSAGEGGCYVRGEVYDMMGNKVGAFERGISDGIVDHAYFELSGSVQGKGFGAKFYKHLEETYMEAGLAEVTIHANIDVGGYAWAKMGYDFQDDYTRDSFMDGLRMSFESRYGHEPEEPNDYGYASRWEQYIYEEIGDEPYHAWDIAGFTGPDGGRLGKELMLGSDWMAYKALSEDHPTWEAGQDYYESKGL